MKGTHFSFRNAKEGNQDLELWLHQLIKPKIRFEIVEFDHQGKHIVLIRIPAAMAEPTCFKKIPKIRIGSHTTDLENYPDYIRQIYNTQIDWLAQIIKTAGIQDLDTEAIQKAREKYKQKYQDESFMQDFDSWENKTFLDKAKVTINGNITNTAILLLGKPESVHYILPAVAEITWKLDAEQKAYEQIKDWVLKFLTEHRQANRKQIDELLWKLLPEDWVTMHKKHKIANLLSEMKREGLITNKGKKNPPCWVKNI
ncbi:MAG: hypothetical protein QME42_06530 [bacterium]|nr:hypothetical protein [bacterium]